ncbi:MAG: tRNA lysidine(34) synthetase TilS [Alphaproteobacteria bacterium]
MMDENDLHGALSVFWQQHCQDVKKVAVAVSGGADSTALVLSLSHFLAGKNIQIYALTVDHALREDSAQEAGDVGKVLSGLSNVTHTVLRWDHGACKPETRIQEHARNARYELIYRFMDDHGLSHLFLGHHMGDQAETFLFRLAKGSGLDGLSCMLPVQQRENVILCRPFLMFGKADLISYCRQNDVAYVDDPSNENQSFARVRLRKSQQVLEEEGLTAKRLATTAYRMARARKALDAIAQVAYEDNLLEFNVNRIVFNFNALKNNEEEVILRVVLKAIKQMYSNREYGVRVEKLEKLCVDLVKPSPFRKRTLGGVIFERNDKCGHLILSRE